MSILADFSNIILFGASQCGKSTTIKHILLDAHNLFETKPTKYIYIYKLFDQNLHELKNSLKNIEFLPNLPTNIEELTAGQAHTILVVDDVIDWNNEYFAKLLCWYSHHYRITVIISTQDLGGKGKYVPIIQKNAHCWILLSSPKNINAILCLSRQMGNYKFLKAAYNDATKDKPYKFIVINAHPKIPSKLRFISHILSTDPQPLTLYIPKD